MSWQEWAAAAAARAQALTDERAARQALLGAWPGAPTEWAAWKEAAHALVAAKGDERAALAILRDLWGGGGPGVVDLAAAGLGVGTGTGDLKVTPVDTDDDSTDEITHGSQVPTSGLVGLPEGWEPNAVVGSILSVSNGQTIEDIQINGDLWLHDGSGGGRTDVHVNRVLVKGMIRCGYEGGPDDRLISNSEIDGSGNGSGELANVPCIDNAGYTVYRSILHKAKRGIVAEYNAAVIESWIKDTWGESYGGSNWDHRSLIGVGFDGEHHHITLQRNFIDGRTWSGKTGVGLSALLVMYDDPNEGSGPHDYVVEDNYWVGGDVSGFWAYLSKAGKPAFRLVFRGNIFDRSSGQFCGQEGFVGSAPGSVSDSEWSNNRWGPPTQSGWAAEGSLISAPW